MLSSKIYDNQNANPTAYPIAMMADPRTSVSRPDFHVFNPITAAFANPKLNNSTAPMHITATHYCESFFKIPDEIIYGRAGTPPRTIKATRVTTPHFLATASSSTTMPSS
jgi:hypothetical protein